MGRGHHPDVRIHRDKTLAGPAATVRAIEYRQVFRFEMWRALHSHGAAAVFVRGSDLLLSKPEGLQHIERRVAQLSISQTELFAAELFTERPFIERKLDFEGLPQCGLQLVKRCSVKTARLQRLVTDKGRPIERPAAGAVGDDILYLRCAVPQRLQRRREALINDLEIPTARQLLELDQGEVRLDAGGVAIHYQPYSAGRSQYTDLGIAEPVCHAKLQRAIPRATRGQQQIRRTVFRLGSPWFDRQSFVFLRWRVVGRPTVVADDAQHVLGIPCIALERSELGRQLGRSGVRLARQDCR